MSSRFRESPRRKLSDGSSKGMSTSLVHPSRHGSLPFQIENVTTDRMTDKPKLAVAIAQCGEL
jgi:hypothetical protein